MNINSNSLGFVSFSIGLFFTTTYDWGLLLNNIHSLRLLVHVNAWEFIPIMEKRRPDNTSDIVTAVVPSEYISEDIIGRLRFAWILLRFYVTATLLFINYRTPCVSLQQAILQILLAMCIHCSSSNNQTSCLQLGHITMPVTTTAASWWPAVLVLLECSGYIQPTQLSFTVSFQLCNGWMDQALWTAS